MALDRFLLRVARQVEAIHTELTELDRIHSSQSRERARELHQELRSIEAMLGGYGRTSN